MTDENYLKKLANMQTQINELVPDSLKENVERRTNDDEYIQGDPDHNVKVALKRLKEIYWKKDVTSEEKQKFAEAQENIICALVFGGFEIVRKEE